MSKPAARIGDMHMCPMVTPGLPPVPHVGGPIVGPGCPTVLIGGMPAAVMGDMCTCVGPPDTIILGSTGVFIGGKPAARMGDQCVHGGAITVGCPTVLIGELGGGGGANSSSSAAEKKSIEDSSASGEKLDNKDQLGIINQSTVGVEESNINNLGENDSRNLMNHPLRIAYEKEVAELKKLGDDLLALGTNTKEEVARILHQKRRDLGVKYKDATPSELREFIYRMNKRDYGDELGPTIEYLVIIKNKTWDDIITSASRPGGRFNRQYLLDKFPNEHDVLIPILDKYLIK